MHLLSVIQSGNVIFNKVAIQPFVSSLGTGGLVLLLFDCQSEIRMCRNLGGQFLVFGAKSLTGFIKAGLGSGNSRVDEVNGEANSGSSGIHSNFLSWLLAFAVGRNPYFFWRGFCLFISLNLYTQIIQNNLSNIIG